MLFVLRNSVESLPTEGKKGVRRVISVGLLPVPQEEEEEEADRNEQKKNKMD